MSRVTSAIVCAFALCLVPSGARAYSKAAAFALPALEGGGGGRHFTGSFADGYTCAVCHGDARAEPPSVDGLPASGFVAGETYELVIAWASEVRTAGLALELVDERGAAAGTIALGGAGQADELCRDDGTGATPRAASLVTPPAVAGAGSRSVLIVDGCGATATRFLWTAPATARGSVFLEAAYVRADGTGGPERDATAQLELQVPPLNVPADARLLDGGCSAVAPVGSSVPSGLALVAVALVVLARRRQRR